MPLRVQETIRLQRPDSLKTAPSNAQSVPARSLRALPTPRQRRPSQFFGDARPAPEEHPNHPNAP
eukprot:333343-Lingulodinium_polyedra.AAC.1